MLKEKTAVIIKNLKPAPLRHQQKLFFNQQLLKRKSNQLIWKNILKIRLNQHFHMAIV